MNITKGHRFVRRFILALLVGANTFLGGELRAQTPLPSPVPCPTDSGCGTNTDCYGSPQFVIVGAHINGVPVDTEKIVIDASNFGGLTIDWIPFTVCGNGPSGSGCDFGISPQPYFILDGAGGDLNADTASDQFPYAEHIDEDIGPGSARIRHSHIKDPDSFLSHSCKHTLQVYGPMHDPVSPCGITNDTATFSNRLTLWLNKSKAECANGATACQVPQKGLPVDLSSGRMFHEMVDLRIDGPLPIEFIRRYDSGKSSGAPGALGFGWQHNGMIRLDGYDYANHKFDNEHWRVFVNEEMRRTFFDCAHATFADATCQGIWFPDDTEHLRLLAGTDPPWQIVDKHGKKRNFYADGRLMSIVDRNGNTLTYGYNATSGLLETISDSFGRSMSIEYDTSNRIHTVSADSRTVTYTYDGSGNLQHVAFPDGSSVAYTYQSPHLLTTATDALSHVIESHHYTSDTVDYTESDGGNYAYEISYTDPIHPTVTNARPSPVKTTFTINQFEGVATDRIGGPGCSSCGDAGNATHKTYDDHLNVTDVTDGAGITTHMTYNSEGNVLTKTEAANGTTPGSRTTTMTYGNNPFNFPDTISVPGTATCANVNRVTTLSYDSNGNLTGDEITGCKGTSSIDLTTSMTYTCNYSHGRPCTFVDPRQHTTTYEYYADNNSNPNVAGRLKQVTNAAGELTQFEDYDYFGNLTKLVDPNNVETDYTYDGRDRVTVIRVKPAPGADNDATDFITQYFYDGAGRLHQVRQPDCVATGSSCLFTFQYGYDNVNRVTSIEDALGNKILYSYDKEGNRTRDEYQDGSSMKRRFTNFSYDNFNRLEYVFFNEAPPAPPTSGSIFYKYAYNADGTLDSEQDPLGHTTSYHYDDLKRLTTMTQTVSPNMLTTRYDYDPLDGLKSVIDPNSLETTYKNADMGWRLMQVSPDTGTTTYDYDNAGDLISTHDANDVTVTREYDAVNRPTRTIYTDSSLNVTNTYGSNPATYSIGRVASVTVGPTGAPVSLSTFAYERRGLLASEQKTIGGVTYTTGYSYDPSGNLLELKYPTRDSVIRQGKATYSYDSTERVSTVSAQLDGATTTFAHDFRYMPFGPRTNLAFDNSLVDARDYDSRYRLTSWTLGNLLDYSHAYDDNSNLITRTDNKIPARSRTFGYDEINRLTCAAGPWAPGTACTSSIVYTYDKNGNRLSSNETSPPTSYTYVTNTNRLATTTTGSVVSNYSYNADGSITADGTHSYQYNLANRLATVDSGSTGTYTYDGENRRDSKIAFGTMTTLYFYDPAGRLLTELVPGASGSETGVDYIYSDGAPIARVDWSLGGEQDIGDFLRASKSSGNVHLDWTSYSPTGDYFVVRRKQVVAPTDKTFNGALAIASTFGSTKTFDDPVLGNGNRYDYSVFKQTRSDVLRYYHTDHLGTPILVTSGSAVPIWGAEHFPFGDLFLTTANDVVNNLRFPGQYFDSESGLHQNWFRDYSSTSGRYSESDPIGLEGGINTYAYAASDPINATDRRGLDLQFIVTRPFQEDPYGHAALRVFGAGYDYTYDFGAYQEMSSSSSGEGVGDVRIWTDFSAYMRQQSRNGASVAGYTFSTPFARDQAVIRHFDRLVSGAERNLVIWKVMQQFVIDDYDVGTNNCTTATLNGAAVGLPLARITAIASPSNDRGLGLPFYKKWVYFGLLQSRPMVSVPADLEQAIRNEGGYYFNFDYKP